MASSLQDAVQGLLKDLVVVEDKIFANGEGEALGLHYQQGRIFHSLCARVQDTDVKFAFMLASAECFSQDSMLSPHCALACHYLAQKIDSVLYYKKVAKKAKYSSALGSQYKLGTQKAIDDLKEKLKEAEFRIAASKTSYVEDAESNTAASVTSSVENAESKTAASETSFVENANFKIAPSETSSVENPESKIATSETSSIEIGEPNVSEIKKSPDLVTDEKNRLRLYWRGLDIKIKRDFMKVNIAELKSFAEQKCLNEHFLFLGKKGLDAFEEVLSSASKDKRWKFWMCRTLCSAKFSCAEKYKSHLELEHAADFKPSLENDKVKRIGKDWDNKINVGEWEPVDTEAAIQMIKNQLAVVKTFASKSKKGWSNEWPLVADKERSKVDKERSKLLQEIKSLLVSFCKLQILPCSIRDWLMRFPVKHLEKLEVSTQSIIDLHIKDTPQSICFLKCHELIQIRDFLKRVECTRNDGTDLVCRAVDSYLGSMKVTEKIELDEKLSYLFLDRRLLKSNNAKFNDEGTIGFLEDPTGYYSNVYPKGDDFISWLADSSSVDKMFPGTIREHNVAIWVAVLRAVQFTCRTLKTKYAKKVSMKDTLKVMLMDSKILLIDNSRIRLLDSLTKLSVFDNRLYMLRLLKPFLLYKIESKVSEAAAAELLNEEDKKKSQALKKIIKENKKPSTRMSSPLDKTVESEPSANLETKDTLASEMGHLEISSNTDNQEDATIVDPDMQNTPGEDPQLELLESALGRVVDMTLKALLKNKVVKVDLERMEQPSYDELEGKVTCALQKVCTAFKSNLLEGDYSVLLSELIASLKKVISMSGDAAEVLAAILQFWPPWKDRDEQRLESRFVVEFYERMRCKRCRRCPNYSEQWSYGLVIAADSIRELKLAFGNIKFEYILKLILSENKMLCDTKEGGCGETNFVYNVLSTIPTIFPVVLEWEKNETGEEISETIKALELKIDIGQIYEVWKADINYEQPVFNYQLVSMVCHGEENHHICLAYRDNKWWVSLIHGSSFEEDVGDWNSVVRFCEKSKFRPAILFYQAVWGVWADFGLF